MCRRSAGCLSMAVHSAVNADIVTTCRARNIAHGYISRSPTWMFRVKYSAAFSSAWESWWRAVLRVSRRLQTHFSVFDIKMWVVVIIMIATVISKQPTFKISKESGDSQRPVSSFLSRFKPKIYLNLTISLDFASVTTLAFWLPISKWHTYTRQPCTHTPNRTANVTQCGCAHCGLATGNCDTLASPQSQH